MDVVRYLWEEAQWDPVPGLAGGTGGGSIRSRRQGWEEKATRKEGANRGGNQEAERRQVPDLEPIQDRKQFQPQTPRHLMVSPGVTVLSEQAKMAQREATRVEREERRARTEHAEGEGTAEPPASELIFEEAISPREEREDLTREDPAFVGFEAIKRQGKMQQIPDALSAMEILCSMIGKSFLFILDEMTEGDKAAL
eukprot:Skav207402  [mRNA]  locus=scaffold646:33772:37118:+ [translate_table: standard]